MCLKPVEMLECLHVWYFVLSCTRLEPKTRRVSGRAFLKTHGSVLGFVVAVLHVSVQFLYSEGKAGLWSPAVNEWMCVDVLTGLSASFESFKSPERAALMLALPVLLWGVSSVCSVFVTDAQPLSSQALLLLLAVSQWCVQKVPSFQTELRTSCSLMMDSWPIHPSLYQSFTRKRTRTC